MSIKTDVDRGLEIVVKIKELKEELEKIEERLKAAGLKGEQVELQDAERDGRQYLAHGSSWIVPIIFTADVIVSSFARGGKTHERVIDAFQAANPGCPLSTFYVQRVTYESDLKNGKHFRHLAAEMLGDAAPAFVSACVSRDKHGIPKNQIKVEWGRAEEKKGSEVSA